MQYKFYLVFAESGACIEHIVSSGRIRFSRSLQLSSLSSTIGCSYIARSEAFNEDIGYLFTYVA
jgi:hypothetical protein